MSGMQVMAVQSSQPIPPPTIEQKDTAKNLRGFLRINKLLDFSYDSSKVPANTTIKIDALCKTVGTREVSGDISKGLDGKNYLTLIIKETDSATRQGFEKSVKQIYAGLHLRGTRQIFSSCHIEGLPSEWGAKIKLELVKNGSYEIDISASPHPKPTP